MKKRLHPLAPKKTPPLRPRAGFHNPALEFAETFNMLTDEEIEECLKGNLYVEGAWLTNLNSATVKNPTGTQIKLYEGRRWDVLADRILGLDEEE